MESYGNFFTLKLFSGVGNDLKYYLFDTPSHKGQFEERYNYLKTIIKEDHDFKKILEITKCRGEAHLKEELERETEKGEEGLILRLPYSYYQTGKTPYLRKLEV